MGAGPDARGVSLTCTSDGEERFEFVKTGGKAAGAKSEQWYRKTVRTFVSHSRPMKEEVFWYDEAAPPESRWRKVGP